jgi:hypothetical protein
MRGRKALLIGLNYPLDPRNRLYGCVNDVKLMASYLKENCSFDAENVSILSDEQTRNIPDTCYVPILERIYELVVASWRENLDLVYIHYSGHGTQITDLSGDENDKLDEGIVPSDFATRGPIIDDVLGKAFMQFNPRTQVIAVFDCCHSGSILDLPFTYDNSVSLCAAIAYKQKIMMISGCRDPQTSADAFDQDHKIATGALTSALLKVLKDIKGPFGGKLPALKLQTIVNDVLKSRGFSQHALLSSSQAVGVHDIFL